MRDKDNVIICRAFRRVSENDYASIYFYLRFNSKKEYNSQVKKIFTKEEWRGKYTIEEKYESIFVCAHWIRSKTQHKFKGTAWPRFDAVITKASTQMYSPSHYRKAK